MITGVILAGGAGRRMGGEDKGLLPLRGRLLVTWVHEALAPQVASVLIVANRNLERYGLLGVPVVEDLRPEFPGPLAGIEAALSHAATEWIITCPVDTPHLPSDYVARMLGASMGRPTVAALNGRLQPVLALLPRSTLAGLQESLDRGERRTWRWLESLDPVAVAFDDHAFALRDADTPEHLAGL